MVGDDFNIDKVTPEMAAKIVKHFILPMFDNAPSSKYGAGKGTGGKGGFKAGIGGQGTIYEELKLSEKLNSMLSEVRNEVQSLTESLEMERTLRLQAQA
jgi:hypothetical protein